MRAERRKLARFGLAFYVFLVAAAATNLAVGSCKYGATGGGGGGGSGGQTTLGLTIAGSYTSTDTVGEEDVVGQPVYFNFDDVGGTSITPRLMGAAKVSGGTGTFYLRLGGTLGLLDGTVIATGTTTSTGYVTINFVGSAFAKPSGIQILQVTFKDGTVGQTASIKGITIGLKAT